MSSNSFEEKKILVQSSQDNLAQLIENLKNKLQQDGSICELSDSELRLLKEKSEFQQSFLPYMETLLPFFIEILKSQCQFKENEIQKTRFSILEIMSKGMIFSCQFSQNIENLFKTLMIILQNDNEVNAQLANRVLIDIIKHFNNKLIFEENYIPMFDFLEKRTEFLSQNCQKLLKSENSQINNQQEPLLRNSESIKFLCEIPNIYIYTLNYVDTGNNNNIKDSLRNAIGNIIKAIKETPYMEIQNKMNKTLSFEIFNVMIKMLQFISIILRRDIRNDKYVKHAKEQNLIQLR